MREEKRRGRTLDMMEDELALYDALSENESAFKVLGGETRGEDCPSLLR